MFRLRVLTVFPVVIAAAASGAGVAAGCSAEGIRFGFDGMPGGSASAGGAAGAAGEPGGAAGEPGAQTGGSDGFGGMLNIDGGATEETPDVAVNPCGSACGPVELCGVDELGVDHDGLDDNCNGMIDETCPCIAGQAHSCFRGDPSFRHSPGCYPGTQLCDETGTWGPCVGGVHADENCHMRDVTGCHPIQAAPFANVDLKEGTGSFSGDALAGSEVWTVACPPGVDPCPSVGGSDPADDFKPLQSGEYTVTYTKRVAGGETATCAYPLFVGARGLRVELEWEHDPYSVDLDLYLHKPNNTQPWTIGGSSVACGYGNCTLDGIVEGSSIRWFGDDAAPPEPVNWYLDPEETNNTCFYAPRGVGDAWRSYGRGCHNPRLDLDNIACVHRVTDPDNPNFCAPENINVDFPPEDGWMRVAVHYFGGTASFDVHPRIKIFCNGELGAVLGPTGFHDPEEPVAFLPEDSGDRFWLVADVVFPKPDPGQCSNPTCIVRPIYRDETMKTPFLSDARTVVRQFGPPYPSLPRP
ncbi:hypothetical protein WMF20_32150 [Sorangium sp. So ce834]|uniref:hypothetical protein n=1 Tax=Sorangium sp. So ce834 TaxID=3133321 RepID=UPI003F60D0AE